MQRQADPAGPGYVLGECGHPMTSADWQIGWRVCRNCPQSPDELPRLGSAAPPSTIDALNRQLRVDLANVAALGRSRQITPADADAMLRRLRTTYGVRYVQAMWPEWCVWAVDYTLFAQHRSAAPDGPLLQAAGTSALIQAIRAALIRGAAPWPSMAARS